MHMLPVRSRIVAVAAAALVVAAACGGGSSEPPPPVELGEGVLPASVPTDFPIPVSAVVGSTLVNHPQTYTEVELRIIATAPEMVQFYTVALVNGGYVIDSSEETGGEWTITFRKDDIEGRVEVSTLGQGVASAYLRLNTD